MLCLDKGSRWFSFFSSVEAARGDVPRMLRGLWRRLAPLPGGKALFGRLLGRWVPYSGTITPRVVELREGYAEVTMADRPLIRNHLRSVHAVALANLAELTANLALLYSLEDQQRFIVTQMTTTYLKKARGLITARCSVVPPAATDVLPRDYDLVATLWNAAGEQVAEATIRSRVAWRP